MHSAKALNTQKQ